ncbi:hypothetical protein SAMN04487926_101360 [Paraburkholderia steynii]|uniref:Uncharacterized protein n=1 Tax=Paraburkholderia steynii TaxID=1245441 RepID=A0A7Z7B4K1_9BURK|nr:hypothetical protein SAMN04487926_101360 [Paraburkholderia steynii]
MFDVMPYWMWVASLIVRARGDVRRSAVVRTFEVSRGAPRTSRTPQTPLSMIHAGPRSSRGPRVTRATPGGRQRSHFRFSTPNQTLV